jgi:hypothetical protein
MRKLTVKNFSVIKEAELEFGKITVLIGPQSSGKSLLCKLAYFLGREVIKVAVDMAVHRLSTLEFKSAVQKDFEKWFPRGGWGDGMWSVSFEEEDYEVQVSCPVKGAPTADVVFSIGQLFERAYIKRLQETSESLQERGFLLAPALQSRAATEFFKIAGRGVWDSSTYIPTQRAYFVDIKKGYRTLAAEADPISAHFADVFANGLKPSSSGSRVSKFLGGDITSWQNEWMLAFQDGRFLALSDLSSGSKETLPILTTLDYYESQRGQSGHLPSAELYEEKLYSFDDFTIEEPESSVFPQTQYELVQEFAALANKVDFVPHFTITTHSPYILTAFNTLIYAGQLANEKPELKDEIATLVPKHFWIEDGSFRAYCIHDGELNTILSESGLIDGEYLDSVSDTIEHEFDSLLRLEYDHTEVS